MKTNSNSYTIIYSVIIVVIVAFLLAFVSSSLKATQEANVALDTQKQILNSLNLRDLDNATAAAKYKEVVKGDSVTKDGDKCYKCVIDGQKKTVYSVKGMGLWGGISGFIAVDADNNTVYGVYFNHEGDCRTGCRNQGQPEVAAEVPGQEDSQGWRRGHTARCQERRSCWRP